MVHWLKYGIWGWVLQNSALSSMCDLRHLSPPLRASVSSEVKWGPCDTQGPGRSRGVDELMWVKNWSQCLALGPSSQHHWSSDNLIGCQSQKGPRVGPAPSLQPPNYHLPPHSYLFSQCWYYTTLVFCTLFSQVHYIRNLLPTEIPGDG